VRYLTLLVVLMGCGDSGISAGESGRLLERWPVWAAAVRVEQCPRPALRTPTTGDVSARLLPLNDKSSPESLCLARVKELRTELGPCLPGQQCGPQTLATVKPHIDVVAACAPLYATIEAVAHATGACSPGSADDFDVPSIASLGNAVRLEVAPLVAEGRLGEAAARVLDSMRLADDYARKGTVLGAAFSLFVMSRLVDTLDEIAVDRRLTPDDAHAMARDLDVLLASAPRWDAIMRQEHVSGAAFLASHSEDIVPALADFEAQDRDIHRVCSGTLRDCVEHYDEISGEGATAFKAYAQRLGMRESALAFLRMQIELRLAPASVCFDRARRRALLQPWADRAVVGDEPEPVVTPPMWERNSDYRPRLVPRVLRCVTATI
jgi:hypothetical protein